MTEHKSNNFASLKNYFCVQFTAKLCILFYDICKQHNAKKKKKGSQPNIKNVFVKKNS